MEMRNTFVEIVEEAQEVAKKFNVYESILPNIYIFFLKKEEKLFC